MSCPKTDHLLQEYFADDLAPFAREEIEKHLATCAHCSEELGALMQTQSSLRQWQEQRVPHWDRRMNLFPAEGKPQSVIARFFSGLQWVPTAASFAMLAILLLNVSVVSGDQGFSIAFGAAAKNSLNLQAELAALQSQQQSEMQALIARVEDRLDSNNVRLLQAVMEQTQQTTSENFEQMYSYFEQQRLLDLQDMRVGYEQLVNSDYETIRSLQQLANFVSYEGSSR
jgi:anti-sigma factor RsiW